MSSRRMCLLPRATLHSDSEQKLAQKSQYRSEANLVSSKSGEKKPEAKQTELTQQVSKLERREPT
jgi:hypothetical protein